MLSFDVMNIFLKVVTDAESEVTNSNYSPIIDQLTLSKHHTVFKCSLLDPNIQKSSFIVAEESICEVTPSRISTMMMS